MPPETAPNFVPYAYVYSPHARDLRAQFPKELLPKLLSVIDDLAVDPDGFDDRSMKMGQGANGELVLYRHPDPPLEILYEIDRQNRKLYFVHFAAPVVQLKQIFVSYSHVDSEWLQRLRKFLDPLEKRGLLNVWSDTKLQPGERWEEAIQKALDSCKIAVLLITQDFLNSVFIQRKELMQLLKKAKEQGLTIFWIAVKASTVNDSPIAVFQAANDPEHPLASLPEPMQDLEFTKIYEKIKEIALAN